MTSSKKSVATRPMGLPKLRVIRQRKGLSIGQLSELSQVRRNVITEYESGRGEPQPCHCRMLAKVLEISPYDLY